MLTVICWKDGRFLPAEEATVSATDLVVQRGYGVFDFARDCHGRLFHFNDHLARLRRSAEALFLPVRLSNAELTWIAERVVNDSCRERPAVRIFVTGGCGSSEPLFSDASIIVLGEERAAVDPEIYTQGVPLMTVEFQRELPEVKSVNYLNAIRIEPLKRRHGVFDVLYYSQSGVTECPRNNFFAVRDGVIVTPDQNVLAGVTRSIVLRLADGVFPVEERTLKREELQDADEAFITSTSKQIVPVTSVDGDRIGTGRPGRVTARLMQLFDDYVEAWSAEASI